jgi:hypothetical protein
MTGIKYLMYKKKLNYKLNMYNYYYYLLLRLQTTFTPPNKPNNI